MPPRWLRGWRVWADAPDAAPGDQRSFWQRVRVFIGWGRRW